MRVRDAMTSPVVTVRPETPIKEAAQVLIDRDFSALPVLDADGGLVGIVTEADLLPLQAPDPRSQVRPPGSLGPAPERVAEVMSQEVISVEPGDELATAAGLMLQAAIKHLPVLEGGKLVGILSRHDIVRILAAPDGGVEARVRDVLAEEGAGLVRAAVRVNRGVVLLSGVVDARTRSLAEALARSVPGVLDVRFGDG